MPLKFWKKEEKEAPPAKEEKPKKAADAPAKEAPKAPPAAPAKAEEKPPEKPAAPPGPEDIARDLHRALVDAGLTIEGTKEVFRKRLTERYGSMEGFAQKYARYGVKSATRFIGTWLGFDVPAKFRLQDLLYSANQRLSSFHIQVDATDEVSIDESSGLRETTLSLGDRSASVQFRTPREVVREINRLVADKGVRFLELETWTDGFTFMLAKNPRWDRLGAGSPVAIKAEETAGSKECPECGSRVGDSWATCIVCNGALS